MNQKHHKKNDIYSLSDLFERTAALPRNYDDVFSGPKGAY